MIVVWAYVTFWNVSFCTVTKRTIIRVITNPFQWVLIQIISWWAPMQMMLGTRNTSFSGAGFIVTIKKKLKHIAIVTRGENQLKKLTFHSSKKEKNKVLQQFHHHMQGFFHPCTNPNCHHQLLNSLAWWQLHTKFHYLLLKYCKP